MRPIEHYAPPPIYKRTTLGKRDMHMQGCAQPGQLVRPWLVLANVWQRPNIIDFIRLGYATTCTA